MKRLVDLVDRGPQDDLFFPSSAPDTIFRRVWPAAHAAVPDVVELGYQGNAAWGQRITIPLKTLETGDLLSWLCLRLKPRSWLGADLESRIASGAWDYADPSGAWMWAASLGSIAVAKVEFEVGGVLVESWDGNWMDVWSRCWMDGGRAASWDSDIYGQLPPWELADTTRPPWTTVLPTEDGYVYCWLPLAFLRRPQTAFPLVAVGAQTEVRVHITLASFADVVRRRAQPRTSAAETPLGETVVLLDKSGPTPIPYEFTLGRGTPGFEDTTVLAGVVQVDEALRESYMRIPMEMLYERVVHTRYDISPVLGKERGCTPVSMNLALKDLNGPVRELCWFIRRKAVWRFNEWTNYGRLLEDELLATVPDDEDGRPIPVQQPILTRARLMVGNAVWRDEEEQWWRLEYGLAHRGGVRVAGGMVYGFVLGDGAAWTAEDLQPAGTVNASRAEMRLDLEILPPVASDSDCGETGSEWEVHVFGIGYNWLRFIGGQVVPLFVD
jgi:hypothetical protein